MWGWGVQVHLLDMSLNMECQHIVELALSFREFTKRYQHVIAERYSPMIAERKS